MLLSKTSKQKLANPYEQYYFPVEWRVPYLIFVKRKTFFHQVENEGDVIEQYFNNTTLKGFVGTTCFV